MRCGHVISADAAIRPGQATQITAQVPCGGSRRGFTGKLGYVSCSQKLVASRRMVDTAVSWDGETHRIGFRLIKVTKREGAGQSFRLSPHHSATTPGLGRYSQKEGKRRRAERWRRTWRDDAEQVRPHHQRALEKRGGDAGGQVGANRGESGRHRLGFR